VIETLSMCCLCRIEGGVEVPADLLLVLPLQMSGRKLVYSQVLSFFGQKVQQKTQMCMWNGSGFGDS
jgi:hypothetical protein